MLAYNGFIIEPAPFLNISKSYDEVGSGKKVGKVFAITIIGRFLPDKGSPNSSGTLYASGTSTVNETLTANQYLSSILQKQKALESLFSSNGKTFYVQGYDGAAALTCNPRVKSIEFPKGGTTSWANVADYQINLEAEVIYIGGVAVTETDSDLVSYHISSAEDTTNLEVLDENLQTYRFTRQLSAKGKLFYSTSGTLDKQPWENAKDYVLNKLVLGINMTALQATGVLNNNSTIYGYNYLRAQNINQFNGTFAVTETWIAYDGGTSTEEYEANVKIDNAGYAQVDLQGKVQGFEVRDETTRALVSTKYTNAKTKFNSILSSMYVRATGLSNIILNPILLNSSAGANPITGVVTYNYTYDNRPSTTVAGALSENISVNFAYMTDIFASIPVLGRAAGPVLQSIQTISESRKGVNIEATLPSFQYGGFVSAKPDTNLLISGFAPSATWVFKSSDNENWDYTKGKYTRQVNWNYGH